MGVSRRRRSGGFGAAAQVFPSFFFGSGVDGDVTVSSSISLSRDMYYNNLTVTSAGTLNPSGYRIFVKNTLTVQAGATISRNGNAGDSDGTPGGPLSSGTLGGSMGGGFGSSGDGDSSSSALGGNGGSGGAGSSSAGGAGGISQNTETSGGLNYGASFSSILRGSGITLSTRIVGGAGGAGGGQGNFSKDGAGGGSGGGVILIIAKYILAEAGSFLSCIGGDGGNSGGSESGGGGGGGGGCQIIFTDSPLSDLNWTTSVLKGSGGSGDAPGGLAGSSGVSGQVFILAGDV